jgi:hypothetical protein
MAIKSLLHILPATNFSVAGNFPAEMAENEGYEFDAQLARSWRLHQQIRQLD